MTLRFPAESSREELSGLMPLSWNGVGRPLCELNTAGGQLQSAIGIISVKLSPGSGKDRQGPHPG